MLSTPQQYLDTLSEPGKSYLAEFYEYMAKKHGGVPCCMFRQRPMYKIGKSYVMFTVAAHHFSLHTLNFELIEQTKLLLPQAQYGKGCVKVAFHDTAAKPLLKQLCDDVIHINSSAQAPPDVLPVVERAHSIANVFAASKAKWLPLYDELLKAAQQQLPPFTEYFPAAGVLWKHGTTFAGISCTQAALRIEFYSDALHIERCPIKYLQTSKNRVSHTVEITDSAGIVPLLPWLGESYALTRKPHT